MGRYSIGCKLEFKNFAALRARLHTGKFSSDKKISFVLNPLVTHESLQDKEKFSVQGKFSCV